MLLASILPEGFDLTSLEGVPIWILVAALVLAVIVVKVLKVAIKWAITLVIAAIIVAWFTGGEVGWNLPYDLDDMFAVMPGAIRSNQ